MYQALYRKYRPNSFDEVVGQDVIVTTLKNALNNNKISHAYLFTGPRGTGKTSIAKIFAKLVNCTNIHDGKACNKCASCVSIDQKQNTDIIEIDAASNNGVDEIRNIKSKITLVPTLSKYKVYIIDEVHMLSTGAFNALLKTLEEPPKHVIFILATTEPQKLPTTILSRCQRYDFKRVADNQIVSKLKNIAETEKIGITDEALYEIARLSDGGMRDSIGMLDQVASYKNKDITVEDVHLINGTLTSKDLSEFIYTIFSKDVDGMLNLLEKYMSDGKNINKIIDEIIYFSRNLLIYNITSNKTNVRQEDYNRFTGILKIDQLYNLIHKVNELKTNIKDTTNIRILLEVELIKIMSEFSEKNISQEIEIPKKSIKGIEKEEKPIEKKVTEESPEEMENAKKIRQIRINNTLAEFNKKLMIDLSKKNDEAKAYLLDTTLGKYAALILDGKIKAASDKYIIYMYSNQLDVDTFNSNLEDLERLIYKVFKVKYKLIAVNSDDWEIIKDEFNNKKKTYTFIEEPQIKKETKKVKKSNDIDNLFDNIVEYVEEEIK